jgi:hypothetical protein
MPSDHSGDSFETATRRLDYALNFGMRREITLTITHLTKLQVPFTGTILCVKEAFPSSNVTLLDSEVIWMRKMRFTLEELQVTANWLVKACLLILYWRIL